MCKKYELLKNDTVTTFDGRTLYRIRALRSIGRMVNAGDLGGYVESDINLSHFGRAWILDDAWVYGEASVIDNAVVYGRAQIFDYALLSEWAVVGDDAQVFGRAEIKGHAKVIDRASVSGALSVCDFAVIEESTRLNGFGRIDGNTRIFRATWKQHLHSMLCALKHRYSSAWISATAKA